ncbi:MAG: VOC family protein [Flavobacteriales bacterium]|nr:VOC family protein [Flavobacteriales bacterium]
MKLRIARHTDNLDRMIEFYKNILGLDLMGEFKDHDEYSGVFLGKTGMNWELEFTSSPNPAKHDFDEDDLLVFYHNTEDLLKIKSKIIESRIPIKKAKNPYWNQNGLLIHDPDGFGIILTTKKINNE